MKTTIRRGGTISLPNFMATERARIEEAEKAKISGSEAVSPRFGKEMMLRLMADIMRADLAAADRGNCAQFGKSANQRQMMPAMQREINLRKSGQIFLGAAVRAFFAAKRFAAKEVSPRTH